MKRVKIEINDIADYENLLFAAVKAAKGKRSKPEVVQFMRYIDKNIRDIQRNLFTLENIFCRYNQFIIRDPKERIITAACFTDRVIHHAIINIIGPVLDKALVPVSFACRTGKGTSAAVEYVQSCMRKYPWYVKIDIKKYFDSIDHGILYDLLARKFKGREFLLLLFKIIDSYHTGEHRGLPIGALTSQYFANFYLNNTDRFILEKLKVKAYARYMDDMIWWCGDYRRLSDDSSRLSVDGNRLSSDGSRLSSDGSRLSGDKKQARASVKKVIEYLCRNYRLEVKQSLQINRSERGITFCSYRIFPNALRLTPRRKKRYLINKRKWENLYRSGAIDAVKLQNVYDSVHSIVLNAESREWRKKLHRAKQEIEV